MEEVTRPHAGTNPWGPAIIDRLKELHGQSLSFGEISRTLSREFGVCVSRSSAIGKADRLRLPKRAMTPAEKGLLGARASQSMRRARKVNDAPPPVAPDIRPPRKADVVPLLVSFENLTHDQCRYPYGESAPYLFCGCEALPALSYCEPHQRLTHSAHVFSIDRRAIQRQQYRQKLKEAVACL